MLTLILITVAKKKKVYHEKNILIFLCNLKENKV